MNKYKKVIENVFHRAFDFKGRSNRYTYRVFFVLSILITISLALFYLITPLRPITLWIARIINILLFFPKLTLRIRRLHDTGHTGWLILPEIILSILVVVTYIEYIFIGNHLIYFIISGVICALYIIYLMYLTLFKKGDEGSNKYGIQINGRVNNKNNMDENKKVVDVNN